jgi:hypothetical protein
MAAVAVWIAHTRLEDVLSLVQVKKPESSTPTGVTPSGGPGQAAAQGHVARAFSQFNAAPSITLLAAAAALVGGLLVAEARVRWSRR